MTFCRICGHNLSLGTERFCPRCGTNLQVVSTDTKSGISGNISNTSGNVIGTGLAGSGSIAGKDVRYIVKDFESIRNDDRFKKLIAVL